MADGKSGSLGVDLDRGDVERGIRESFGQQETRDAVDGDAGNRVEREFDPGRIFALLQ